MNQTTIQTILMLALLFLGACQAVEQESHSTQQISTAKAAALGPYFTKDNHGNSVLCWSELASQDSLHSLKFAIYDHETSTFSAPVAIPGTRGTSTAPESMSKLAFKSDGTMVALFNKPFKNPKTRFASAIYYTLSTDGGKSWSSPEFIHDESTDRYGRSFFDLTTLADGEVGAIWLDGRFGEEEEGSALFFAKTEPGKGFGPNQCIARNTCECCRTDILMDQGGGIHIAYRGIQSPLDRLGKQVRDMVYAFSSDNGTTFSSEKAIGKDNWEIDGCPHTGPSLAVNQQGVHAIWFTGGGIPGLYMSTMNHEDPAFGHKMEISPSGRHPQQVALENNSLAIVWDELMSQGEQKETDMHGQHQQHSTPFTQASSGGSQVVFTVVNKGKIEKQFRLNPMGTTAHHPVVTALDAGALAAWVNEKQGHSSIVYAVIPLK